MNSAGDKKMPSTLTKLLRSELRDARCSITQLALTDTEFVANEHGDGTTSKFEETSKEESDSRGLNTMHQAGVRKRESCRYGCRVQGAFQAGRCTSP